MAVFRTVLHTGPDDRLGGVVAVDEAAWQFPHRAKPKRNRVWIVITAEKRGGTHGRIALQMNPNAFDYDLADKVQEMVKPKSTIETRRPEVYEKWIGQTYVFRHVKTASETLGKDLLPICGKVAAHVANVLQNTFRCAFSQEHLQSYLDEIVFRWNYRHDANEAAWTLLSRLVPPYKPSVSELEANDPGSDARP